MFAETRSWQAWSRALLGAAICLLALGLGPSASGDDRVYRYRRADGREVFTNARGVLVEGMPPTALTLPRVTNQDLAGATPLQLQQLDRGVQHAHDALQAGEQCKAIRAASRVRTSSLVWHGHLRELCVGAFLMAAALIVLSTWQGRLRRLISLAPLLGSLFLGYVIYARVAQRVSMLREGLRACSSDLPAAAGVSPGTVAARLDSAVSLKATIDRAYRERGAAAELALHER
jgi:hypothetical protein